LHMLFFLVVIQICRSNVLYMLLYTCCCTPFFLWTDCTCSLFFVVIQICCLTCEITINIGFKQENTLHTGPCTFITHYVVIPYEVKRDSMTKLFKYWTSVQAYHVQEYKLTNTYTLQNQTCTLLSWVMRISSTFSMNSIFRPSLVTSLGKVFLHLWLTVSTTVPIIEILGTTLSGYTKLKVF
jgi:hypothetical protein